MTNSDDGNHPPANDQSTPEQGSTNQLQPVIALLTSIQQSADEDRATTRRFRDIVTRRLANPLEPIESVCFNLRNPSDEQATQRRLVTVAVNPPAPPAPNQSADDRTFDHFWGPYLNNMSSADVDRLLTYLTSRNNAANGNPSATAGAQGTSQVINQNRPEEPDNAELQALRQSDLEQKRRIKELEDALKTSRAEQTQNTTPHTENPIQKPDEAHNLNESVASESSRNARTRAQRDHAASGTSATMSAAERADAELASREQDKEYGKAFADPNLSPTARDETSASGDRLNGRDRDEDDFSAHESEHEAVDGKSKRRKGKERAPNATSKRPSKDVPAKSRTPSATDSKLDGNAPLTDTEPAHTSNTATQVEQSRRKSQRMIQLKADEAEKSKTKPENQKELREEPWINPKTGKPGKGYAMKKIDSEEEAASSSDSKSRKRATKNALPPPTSKTQLSTGAAAGRATANSETKAPRGRKGGKTGIDDVQKQGILKRISEVEETEPAETLNETTGSDDDINGPPLLDEQFQENFMVDPVPEPADDDEEEEEEEEDGNEDEEEDEDESDDEEGYRNKNDHRPARVGEKRKSNSSRPAAESNEENEEKEEEEEEDIRPSPKKKQKPSNAKPAPAIKSEQEEVDGLRRDRVPNTVDRYVGYLRKKK